ncbi:MAG: hypothetical protein OEY09_01655 [Gammaproteobacteria bacterium]|nr:hypothetical protein [Gammaproteobacteria bacterium]
MKQIKYLPIWLYISVLVTGCGGGGGNSSSDQSFTVTVNEIEIKRSADQLDMPVGGLPAVGAIITVQ